jgi:uncharacterized protein YjgD (DUF1641 family)
MSETVLQEQISELNRKIDFLIEEVSLQKAKRQELEDLMNDLQIIGKDMFNTAVVELDKAGIEVNNECVTRLGLNVVRNVSNFNYLFATLQSAIDLWQDLVPILRQMGLDAINKFAEFEQKGYFEYLGQLAKIMETVTKNYTVDDLKKLNDNVPLVINIVRNVSTTDNLKALQHATEVLAKTKMNEKLDDKSLYKLYKELKSPEVRRSLSYTLRILREIVNNNNTMTK